MSFLFFYILILVHPYLAMWWKSFPKAGRKEWEALIPGYNYFVVFKITCGKPFWALLMLIPGVHLVMLAVANASYLKRFGYYSFTDTLQAIFFPYLLSYNATSDQAVFGKETNWSNSKEIETRKWSDHIALFLSLPIIGHILTIAISAVSRDKPGNKSRVKEWGDSIIFALVAACIIRTYVFEPFQIPTGSMEKTMLVGDFLFVNKLAYGPKVPVTPLSYPLVHNNVPWINIQSYTTLEKGSYFRLPGFGKVERNDVVVFNYPSGDTAIYDPRVPEGLMGHDYHGVLISEALYYWSKKKNAPGHEHMFIGRISNHAAITFFDALGLSTFAVVGVIVAVEAKIQPLWMWGPLLAALTGAGGGILRDVIRADADNPGLKGSFYAEVALIWGLVLSLFLNWYSFLPKYELIHLTVAVVGVILGGLATRMAVVYFKIRSPMY